MDFFIPLVNTLALAAGLLALMVGLVLSPWQFLLVLLILGLLSTQRLLAQTQRPLASTTLTPPDTQQDAFPIKSELAESQDILGQVQEQVLIYRGTRYRHTSKTSDTSDAIDQVLASEISGRYRGSFWNR